MQSSNENGADAHEILGLGSNDLRRAQWERDVYAIPDYVYAAWRAQRNNAAARGIPFRFGLLRYHLWWRSALDAIGPHAKRGLRRGEYMMCRRGDAGAYEPDNVYAGTALDNRRDIPPDRKAETLRKVRATREANGNPLGCHLRVRGDGHPRSHAVITPLGRFGSIALASEAHGFTRQAGLQRVRSGAWQLDC